MRLAVQKYYRSVKIKLSVIHTEEVLLNKTDLGYFPPFKNIIYRDVRICCITVDNREKLLRLTSIAYLDTFPLYEG